MSLENCSPYYIERIPLLKFIPMVLLISIPARLLLASIIFEGSIHTSNLLNEHLHIHIYTFLYLKDIQSLCGIVLWIEWIVIESLDWIGTRDVCTLVQGIWDACLACGNHAECQVTLSDSYILFESNRYSYLYDQGTTIMMCHKFTLYYF